MPARLIAFVVALAIAGTVAPAAAETPVAGRHRQKHGWPADAVAGSVLVTAVDARAAAALGGESFGRVAVVPAPPGQEAVVAAALRRLPGVVAAEPDHWVERLLEPTDPRYPEQWAHSLADAPRAWDVTTGDPTVRVAVIDSGVDARHPDLRANIVEQHQVTQDGVRTVSGGSENDLCDEGHGTQVAGILGAAGGNGIDVSGVAWSIGIVDIAAVDTVRCQVTESILIEAVHHALTRDVDVVTLSSGKLGDTCPTAWQAAVDAARRRGVTVVAAAGNDQEDFPGATVVPASCNGVISVGAADERGSHSSYSSANDQIDVVAPGGDPLTDGGVLTTDTDDRLVRVYGTSFAAPYVAGVAALLLSVDPSLSPSAVEDHLERAAGATRRTPQLGWGIVDAGAAVAAVAAGTTADHKPDPPFPVGLVVRVSEGTERTDAIRQAVAMSRRVFEADRALHVVIGRADDHADALAGSSLGFGSGPLLFTNRTGPLDTTTRGELERVLPPGGLVYLLGGSAALPATLEGELTRIGYDVRRLAGETREGTAAAVADEIRERLPELGFPAPDRIILATARSWPDAVTAGSLGSYFGYPILLTPPDSLHPTARWVLGTQQPAALYVVGGTAAVSDEVMRQAQVAAGDSPGQRLAGVDRFGTALQVAIEVEARFRAVADTPPLVAIAVNLRRSDAFAHVLSATAATGTASGVFIPVEGAAGDVLPAPAREIACRANPLVALVAGGVDIVSEAMQHELNRLLEEGC